MEYVLDTLEMKRCDEAAINEYGIESLVLMERAALETAKIIVEHYGKDIYVGVVAGRGNNGGDGVAIARILNESGIRVEINILDDDHLAIVLLELSRVEHRMRIHAIAASEGLHGTCHTLGSLHQAFALGIFAQQTEYLTIVLL